MMNKTKQVCQEFQSSEEHSARKPEVTPALDGETSHTRQAALTTHPLHLASMAGPLAVPSTSAPTGNDVRIIIQNSMAAVNLGCKLDLKAIAQRARNAEYNPRRFAGLIMRIREPRATALVFRTGKMVVTGAKGALESKRAARRFARIIQKCGFNVHFLKFNVSNMLASCNVGFNIRLEGLIVACGPSASYEPELNRALILKLRQPKVSASIFISGKVIFTGAKTSEEVREALTKIYPLLETYRID